MADPDERVSRFNGDLGPPLVAGQFTEVIGLWIDPTPIRRGIDGMPA